MTSMSDAEFLRLALRLARRGLGCTSPNPMVGEVLDGLIAFCEGEYVRSAQKLGRMKRRLERTGFVSFW